MLSTVGFISIDQITDLFQSIRLDSGHILLLLGVLLLIYMRFFSKKFTRVARGILGELEELRAKLKDKEIAPELFIRKAVHLVEAIYNMFMESFDDMAHASFEARKLRYAQELAPARDEILAAVKGLPKLEIGLQHQRCEEIMLSIDQLAAEVEHRTNLVCDEVEGGGTSSKSTKLSKVKVANALEAVIEFETRQGTRASQQPSSQRNAVTVQTNNAVQNHTDLAQEVSGLIRKELSKASRRTKQSTIKDNICGGMNAVLNALDPTEDSDIVKAKSVAVKIVQTETTEAHKENEFFPLALELLKAVLTGGELPLKDNNKVMAIAQQLLGLI